MAPPNPKRLSALLHRLSAHRSIRRTRTELSSWLDGHRIGAQASTLTRIRC